MGVMHQKYVLRKYKTRQLLHDYVTQYNSRQMKIGTDGKHKKDYARRLRSNHVSLAEYLIELCYLTLEKHQTHTPIVPGTTLPMVRTNNVQLCKHFSCSERTVINLRKRLVAAGVIEEEVWHGSNSGYEIRLSEQILHLSRPGFPDNDIAFFGAQKEKFSPYSNQLQVQDTKELIQLSGDDFQLGAENQPLRGAAPVDKSPPVVENAPENVENHHSGCGLDTKQGTDTGYTTARRESGTAPPVAAAPPQSLEEALRPLPQELAAAVRRHIGIIWSCVLLHLSDNWDFLHESEVEKGKAALAEYLIYAKPERYAAGATEICSRIVLVAKWIDRGHKLGQNRWVPLPSRYFDHRNTNNGFVKTKAWFKKHQAAQKDIQDRVLVTKATRRYLNSLRPGSKHSPAEVFRQVSQYLGKRDQKLLQLFHQNIQEHEHEKQSAAA